MVLSCSGRRAGSIGWRKKERARIRTRGLALMAIRLVRRSVDHLYHVRQLGDRAANLGGILELDHTMHLAEAEPGQDLLLRLGATDRRADLLDLDLRHHRYSAIAAA